MEVICLLSICNNFIQVLVKNNWLYMKKKRLNCIYILNRILNEALNSSVRKKQDLFFAESEKIIRAG